MLGIESAERVRITESEGTEHEDRSKEEDACKRGRRERQREREKKKKDKQKAREISAPISYRLRDPTRRTVLAADLDNPRHRR